MKILTFILIYTIMGLTAYSGQHKILHDFKAETIEGESFDMSNLKGKKVLIVNTASKCGFTKQYEGLQELYEKYGGDDFTIIGFPANNFANQEPGSDEEIQKFCQVNYGVTFQMISKISVKGKDQHPIYQWLTNKEKNGLMDSKVHWNFQKYMINENGELVDYVKSKVKPMNEKIVNWIKE